MFTYPQSPFFGNHRSVPAVTFLRVVNLFCGNWEDYRLFYFLQKILYIIIKYCVFIWIVYRSEQLIVEQGGPLWQNSFPYVYGVSARSQTDPCRLLFEKTAWQWFTPTWSRTVLITGLMAVVNVSSGFHMAVPWAKPFAYIISLNLCSNFIRCCFYSQYTGAIWGLERLITSPRSHGW